MSISTNPNLVSVIITTFNRGSFIIDAIDSVIAQSYKNWELIIIDDGSTDNTKDIIEKYLESEKISYYYQNNQKQAGALNTGLKYANGEWIAFLDSDNKWLPDRLTLGINHALSNPDIGLIYGDIYTINEGGERVSENNMKRYSGNVTARLLFDNFISFNTTLTRKEILEKIGGFNAELDRAPDYDCWLRVSTITKVLYIGEYLAEYRVMDNQISSDKTSRFDNNEKTLKRFLHNYPSAVTITEKEKRIICILLTQGVLSKGKQKLSNVNSCISYFLRRISILVWPMEIPASFNYPQINYRTYNTPGAHAPYDEYFFLHLKYVTEIFRHST